jgi:MFS family permease
MTSHGLAISGRGKWMALAAALLGWMFDGMEMGLFPQVARPALLDVLGAPDLGKVSNAEREHWNHQVTHWFAIATAGFLIGAATGGVLFGWLGDRFGRVRAMTFSVLTYAIFSGACGLATEAWHFPLLRFVAALGMGGEWALGVSLVMEVWPIQSRGFLAGLIGAAANFGYMLVALIGLSLHGLMEHLTGLLLDVGLSSEATAYLTRNNGWRILMMLCTFPALLTFFIRLFVPESEKWLREQERGTTSHWAGRDLLGVFLGSAAALGFIGLWAVEVDLWLRLVGSAVTLTITLFAFLYPMTQFLRRAEPSAEQRAATLRRMLLGASLSGVALLGTWAAIQMASAWANELTNNKVPTAAGWTQFASALGAVLGSMLGAMCGDWFGRRPTYAVLCLGALGSSLLFYQGNTEYGMQFLSSAFLAGGITAAFYGWLPLYLPELFRTSVRATGQGFSFNFGRVLAAIGVLQIGNIRQLLGGGYPTACSLMSLVYLVGVGIIWLAPETRGKPLPE